MSIVMQINPFEFFTDTHGDALDAGFIWIGEINKDPRQYPVTIYYDEALAQPAAMPLRTSNGYIMRNGSPTFLFIGGNYSILVLNKRGEQVYYVPDFLMTGSSAAVSANDLISTAVGKGASLVGYTRKPLAAAVSNVQIMLDTQSYSIWEFAGSITSMPTSDPATWDWTPAFAAAMSAFGPLGGVLTMGVGGTYLASLITLKRFVIIDGGFVANTILKQIGGTNADFIVSENFAALTGTATTVSGGLVPSWFGLKDIRVDGNKAEGNTSGRLIAWYGPAQQLIGTVHFSNCGNSGEALFTEDSNTASGTNFIGQEEGKFGNVFVMNNAGIGWRMRGPHNSGAQSIICGFNGGFGFIIDTSANTGGSFDHIGMLHTYANGRAVEPATDEGCILGGICRISVLVSDGDNCTITADRVEINTYRCFNLGGQRDGLIVDGNNVVIDNMSGNIWSLSGDRVAVTINGDRFKCSGMNISGNNITSDGLVVNGNFAQISGIELSNYTGVGKTAIRLSGSKHYIQGNLSNNTRSFNYIAGLNNTVQLELQTNAGQVPVVGDSPGSTDRFDLRASGVVAGGTQARGLISPNFALDVVQQDVVIPHGLLYTPPRENVTVTEFPASPTGTYSIAFKEVKTTDATSITVGVRLGVTAGAGLVGRLALTAEC